VGLRSCTDEHCMLSFFVGHGVLLSKYWSTKNDVGHGGLNKEIVH
jgi:hypothetical protein